MFVSYGDRSALAVLRRRALNTLPCDAIQNTTILLGGCKCALFGDVSSRLAS